MTRFTNCLYREVCDYDSECKNTCVRYAVTKYMLEKSQIPKSKWGVNQLVPDVIDVKAFQNLAVIRDKITDFVDGGNNLYLYSVVCGNGKTTWAIKLMLQYFNEVWEYTGFNARGLFLNVPWFLNKCKETISKPDADFIELKDNLSKVDLVIWDDIASTKLSNYDYGLLLSYIDNRVVSEKANIYTGNVLTDELVEYVGERLSSRILNGVTIQLKGKDMRDGTASSDFSNLNV